MKSITLNQALSLRCCYTDNKIIELFSGRETLTVDNIVDLDIPDKDKIWLFCNPLFIDKSQAVEFTIFCAEQCLHIFESKYPADNRPRKAIESAKVYLEDLSEENKKCCAEAASAAYASAIYASATYASAAYASAASATCASAIYVSATDAYASAASAASATYASAAATYSEQLNFLVKLIKSGS